LKALKFSNPLPGLFINEGRLVLDYPISGHPLGKYMGIETQV